MRPDEERIFDAELAAGRLAGSPSRISYLAGALDHRCSILEAQRAVGQLLDQVLVEKAR